MELTKVCSGPCQRKLPANAEYFHKKITGKYGFTAKCKLCIKEYAAQHYRRHREKRLEEKKIELKLYPEKVKQRRREQYIKHRDKRLKNVEEYRLKNREKVRKQVSDYTIKRYHSDINFKLKMNLSRRMRSLISKEGKRTVELIGCSVDDFKAHMESLFQEGMCWDNYGRNGWHIDHILPCTSFDLTDPEQRRKCFHYTNLQPLWEADNIIKSNKVPYIV